MAFLFIRLFVLLVGATTVGDFKCSIDDALSGKFALSCRIPEVFDDAIVVALSRRDQNVLVGQTEIQPDLHDGIRFQTWERTAGFRDAIVDFRAWRYRGSAHNTSENLQHSWRIAVSRLYGSHQVVVSFIPILHDHGWLRKYINGRGGSRVFYRNRYLESSTAVREGERTCYFRWPYRRYPWPMRDFQFLSSAVCLNLGGIRCDSRSVQRAIKNINSGETGQSSEAGNPIQPLRDAKLPFPKFLLLGAPFVFLGAWLSGRGINQGNTFLQVAGWLIEVAGGLSVFIWTLPYVAQWI